MTSNADDTFRTLFKNDIHQTTDQWRERTLQRLGATSGQWTAWVERDNIPKPPGPRPRAPTKPSSDSLMTLIKAQHREKIFTFRVQYEPQLTLEEVPLPNDLEIWQMYEEAYAAYQDAIKAYEYQDKLARETFPEENKKVFPALIKCISFASVQDLKRSPEGAAFFADHDAYNFFKLAIAEHAYLPTTISAAAVSRAKEQLENLRQKSEDTITEHVNEFRRRLEVLQQAKGSAADAGYADYELRDLLIRSLYSPMWTPWIENREDTDTLPTTFEDLVLLLSTLTCHLPMVHVVLHNEAPPRRHQFLQPPANAKSAEDPFVPVDPPISVAILVNPNSSSPRTVGNLSNRPQTKRVNALPPKRCTLL